MTQLPCTKSNVFFPPSTKGSTRHSPPSVANTGEASHSGKLGAFVVELLGGTAEDQEALDASEATQPGAWKMPQPQPETARYGLEQVLWF